MITRRILSGALSLLVLLSAAGCQARTPQPTATPAPVVTPSPTPLPTPEPTPAPDPIRVQLEGMTTEEKVGQLLVVGFDGTQAGADVTAYVQEYQVGGVILFKRNVESAEQLVGLTNEVKGLNGGGIPLFVSVDQEGGRVDRMPPEVHRTPKAGDVTDPGAYGAALAAACAAFGFNLDFAPSLDVWSNPDNTVIGDRALGTDAETVAERGPVAAQALAGGGVIPVVKHFPGHGDTDVDSHADLPVVEKTVAELRGAELKPFQAAIDGGTPAVMVAHILMKALDPDRPASLSPAVVNDLLRGEMGFGGVVFTDDMTMGAITEHYGVGEACVMAVEAGCDVALVCHGRDNVDEARTALLEAVEAGRISQARLDESVYRVLALKVRFGVEDGAVDGPDVEALNQQIDEILK